MTEGSYEYECSRAELLGIPKPSYEEFLSKKAEIGEVIEEDLETENLTEAEGQDENLKGIGGKLDELNQILHGTQKKLNRFKDSYTSLTNILKIKLGRNPPSSDQVASDTASANDGTESVNSNTDKITEEVNESIGCDNDRMNTNQSDQQSLETSIRKSDLSKALDNQVNNLDRLTEKAELAEISMRQQTSQMKKFLNFGLNMGRTK